MGLWTVAEFYVGVVCACVVFVDYDSMWGDLCVVYVFKCIDVSMCVVYMCLCQCSVCLQGCMCLCMLCFLCVVFMCICV